MKIILQVIAKIVEFIKPEGLTWQGKFNCLMSLILLAGICVVNAGSTIRYIGKLASDTIKSIALNQNIIADTPDPTSSIYIWIFFVELVVCITFVFISYRVNNTGISGDIVKDEILPKA